MEEDMVAKMRIVLYPGILREHRVLSVSIPENYPGQAVGDFLSGGRDRDKMSGTRTPPTLNHHQSSDEIVA
jgi:hypothetical protein